MATPDFKAGTNVFAKIDGKEIGPVYLVQIADGKATLQGKESHVVPVADLLHAPTAKASTKGGA